MANDKPDPATQQALLNISKQLEASTSKRLEDQGKLVQKYVEAAARIDEQLEAEKNLTAQQALKSQQLKLQETIAISTKALHRIELKHLEELVRKGEVLTEADQKQLKIMKEKVKVYDRINKVAEKAPEYISTLFSEGGSAVVTKGLNDISGSLKGKLTESLKTSAKSATSAGGALKAMAGPAAALVLLAFATEIFKLAVELGNAENAFMKATGANREFARSISNSYEETRKFGATAAETSAAMQSLFTGFTDFTFQDAKTRESLTETATVLAKLGVSNQDFATSIQTMTKAMGMSADAAGQQMLNLEKFAEELGVAPSKLAGDFAGAGNMMAKMGDQGVDAFKDLQIASKITGLEMQKMLNITDKFDTFEGAAAQAGKLNAALGGNFVNAMDLMMETDPAARFGMIRDSILDAGLSFDEMSYYQKKFYAESLGLSDVGDLALMLSGNMDAIPGAIQKTSQEYEEAADRAKEVASFQEQLNLLFVQLIPIVTPLIDYMSGLLSIMHELAPVINIVGKVLGVLLAAIVVIPYAVPALFTWLISLVAGFDSLRESIENIGYTLFVKPFASSFLEGLGKVGNAFDYIKSILVAMSRPIETVSRGFNAIGSKFRNFIGLSGEPEAVNGMATAMQFDSYPSSSRNYGGNRQQWRILNCNNIWWERWNANCKTANGNKLKWRQIREVYC